MISKQAQAWFLVRHLRSQDLAVEADGTAVKISAYFAQRPRDIDPEVLESIRCLKAEILLILRLEQQALLARKCDRSSRARRNKWKYKQGDK